MVNFFAEKTCPKPDDSVLNDAILLSKREYFFYEEYVTFRCNHGYALSDGNVEVNWRCKADQTWDNSLGDPQCQSKFSNRVDTIYSHAFASVLKILIQHIYWRIRPVLKQCG